MCESRCQNRINFLLLTKMTSFCLSKHFLLTHKRVNGRVLILRTNVRLPPQTPIRTCTNVRYRVEMETESKAVLGTRCVVWSKMPRLSKQKFNTEQQKSLSDFGFKGKSTDLSRANQSTSGENQGETSSQKSQEKPSESTVKLHFQEKWTLEFPWLQRANKILWCVDIQCIASLVTFILFLTYS